jgi:hypothetical protein
MLRGLCFFIAGVAAIQIAGWVGFPKVLYSTKAQPLEYRHKTHAAKSGSAECETCHTLREDGVFAGLPATESCAGCHMEAQGKSAAEAKLVNNYVKTEKETPWLVYARQPANVRFSHAIHTKRAGLKCDRCHGNQGESDAVRPYQENRISGYSRDIWGHSISRLRRTANEGMKMDDCEKCHHEKGLDTGCLGCHQ